MRKPGTGLKSAPDLQVLRMGDLYFYAVPGEPLRENRNGADQAKPREIGIPDRGCQMPTAAIFPPGRYLILNNDMFVNERGSGYYAVYMGLWKIYAPVPVEYRRFSGG